MEFIMVGFGAVAYGLLEVFNKEKLYLQNKFTIIEPRDKKKEIDFLFHSRKPYEFIQKAITRENVKEILLPLLSEKTILINLSVDVDSLMIMELTNKKKSLYLDTSLENYEDLAQTRPAQTRLAQTRPAQTRPAQTYKEIKNNTLYFRQKLAEKTIKGKTTSVLSFGMNPGLIQEYVKKALKEYAKLKNPKLLEHFKGNYGKLAKELECTECCVVEYDSQKTKVKPTKDCFVNTWSSVGYQCEAIDNVMLNLSNEDQKYYEKEGVELIKPDDKDTNIVFLPDRGMDVYRSGITLDDKGIPFQYEGRLIPHSELSTLGAFLRYENDSPSIMYIYRSCDVSIQSLNFVEENNYQQLKDDYVLKGKDILKGGWDSIGALLKFKNGNIFWGGTVLGINDTRKMGFKSGPTVIQVAGSLNACIKWILKNRTNGLTDPEQIPHKFIFKEAEKYLGKQFFKLL